MENRRGLKYLAWPTRRIQSISSGIIGRLSNASSAAASRRLIWVPSGRGQSQGSSN